MLLGIVVIAGFPRKMKAQADAGGEEQATRQKRQELECIIDDGHAYCTWRGVSGAA